MNPSWLVRGLLALWMEDDYLRHGRDSLGQWRIEEM